MTLLMITDIPPYDLSNVQAVLREAIYWSTHTPWTQEELQRRDDYYHRLRQCDWHVTNAMQGGAE